VGFYYPIDWRFSGSLSKSEQNERNQPVWTQLICGLIWGTWKWGIIYNVSYICWRKMMIDHQILEYFCSQSHLLDIHKILGLLCEGMVFSLTYCILYSLNQVSTTETKIGEKTHGHITRLRKFRQEGNLNAWWTLLSSSGQQSPSFYDHSIRLGATFGYTILWCSQNAAMDA
jgi:hypothetical protein